MIRRRVLAAIENLDVSLTVKVDRENHDTPIEIIKVELAKPGLASIDILPYLSQIDIDMLAQQVQLDLDL